MKEQYPTPCTEEAVAQGCTCDPEKQTNPNWTITNPKCPVHGSVEYLLWAAGQGRKRKGGRT
jgi:hypothetical protein